ncbi:MAG: methylated-DNA--[protein]-cysteine S-methyltransferase [Chloroflexota bacterium]
MLSCEQTARLLDAYRTAELDSKIQAEVRAHLDGCEACTLALLRLKEVTSALHALAVSAPPSLLGRISAAMSDQLGRISTALGQVWVGFNARGVTFVSLDPGDAETVQLAYRRRLGRDAVIGEIPSQIAQAVVDAAEGRWSSDVPVDLDGLPTFERVVLEKMRTIPRGELRPYAWLATEAGSPRAVRAVGNIMNRNPVPLLLPCHRVVPSTGGIGNYAYGSGIKRTLLEREGVSTEAIDELARRKVRYLGSDTTRIYCYPTCRDARRIQLIHQVMFSDERAASAAGYRPCKHCRPLASAA